MGLLYYLIMAKESDHFSSIRKNLDSKSSLV